MLLKFILSSVLLVITFGAQLAVAMPANLTLASNLTAATACPMQSGW